jgi:alpha-beta hydrolase superfamily lysophospholipase
MEHVQLKLYAGDRHEILNEKDRKDIYGDIYRWLLQRV